MQDLNLHVVKDRSMKIRKRYHELERLYHGKEWTIEEDALAFLTDAGLVGRYTMSKQGRWPKENTEIELQHKLGECFWWLTILAERMDIDINVATETFLVKTENLLK
ncbi:MAG TPA: MazG-like protein [Chitinispirillaceae bacterium]|nr:MazG-like protein [Chitinispirillaceae bacterium]